MSSKAEAIERYILRIIEKSESDAVELQRAELSGLFACVPSQINYVLNTRFTTSRGFIVESRRGGGGYLRIVKLPVSGENDLLKLIGESEGKGLSEQAAVGLINRLVEEDILSAREARLLIPLLRAVTLERGREEKDELRMDIIRALILAILRES